MNHGGGNVILPWDVTCKSMVFKKASAYMKHKKLMMSSPTPLARRLLNDCCGAESEVLIEIFSAAVFMTM